MYALFVLFVEDIPVCTNESSGCFSYSLTHPCIHPKSQLLLWTYSLYYINKSNSMVCLFIYNTKSSQSRFCFTQKAYHILFWTNEIHCIASTWEIYIFWFSQNGMSRKIVHKRSTQSRTYIHFIMNTPSIIQQKTQSRLAILTIQFYCVRTMFASVQTICYIMYSEGSQTTWL